MTPGVGASENLPVYPRVGPVVKQVPVEREKAKVVRARRGVETPRVGRKEYHSQRVEAGQVGKTRGAKESLVASGECGLAVPDPNSVRLHSIGHRYLPEW
jgi:hypothetical protein